MIECLKIEITPVNYVETTVKRLKIELKVTGKPISHFEQHCDPDDFVSFLTKYLIAPKAKSSSI